MRYETRPGKQLQADFGELWVPIGGVRTKVHLCVLTLGYSRRQLVRVFRQQRQRHWLQALEEAFRFWGGIPEQVLVDNAKALITINNPRTGELVVNPDLCRLCPALGVHAQGLLAAPAADQREG